MTELSIRPDEIAAALKKHVESFRPTVTREEVGRVTEAGDGIARVEGLPSAMGSELLEFPGGIMGMALNLDLREIGCIIFGDAAGIEEGDEVRRTGRVLSVPVGDGFLGRVVDPLGRPLDGKGDVEVETSRALELQAPSVVQRQSVKEPLETGIKAIDAMTNIGRGQRELIIGDQKTGKTAICLDTIINQRQHWGTGRQVKCVYVAIGQKGSTVREVVQALEENDAMDFTVVINAPASMPAPFKYIAPYAGSAMGQHWMYRGEHALIIFDDLSKQAEAYREISLLLRRPAGREAYPGDVFYLHSRLLERCAKLSDSLGGGSLTGLPIIETKGNDVSAYIPTNVISITDGQIYLEPDLFNAGQRPAINVGISVSRVGGSAQIRAMRQVAGTLRIDLAQRQVISIWSGGNGFLDQVPVPDVRRFERELLDSMEANHPEVGQHIREHGTLPEDVEARLREAVTEFARRFRTSDGRPALKEEPVEPMGEDEEGQEAVRRYRRDTPEEFEAKSGPAGQGASGTP